MRHRLLADTCAALKLASFGDVFFKSGALPRGDLILHPLTFAETKRWHPDKKKKLEPELQVLSKIRATPGLASSGRDIQSQVLVIDMAQQELGTSIGRTDKEILATILLDGKMGLVTNDAALSGVASDGFEVEVASAEEIVVEGLDAGLISLDVCRISVKRWGEINSHVLSSFVDLFRKKKILE